MEALVAKGNVVARLRMAELEHLEVLLEPYRTGTAGVSPVSAEVQRAVPAAGGQVDGQGYSALGDGPWGVYNTGEIDGHDILALAQELEHDDPSSWALFDMAI